MNFILLMSRKQYWKRHRIAIYRCPYISFNMALPVDLQKNSLHFAERLIVYTSSRKLHA